MRAQIGSMSVPILPKSPYSPQLTDHRQHLAHILWAHLWHREPRQQALKKRPWLSLASCLLSWSD